MQTKNIYSQIANKGHLSLKSICFVFLAEIDQIIILRFEQNESDTTNTLGIFGLFMRGKSTKLGMLQAFLRTLAVIILYTNYPSSRTMPTQLVFV